MQWSKKGFGKHVGYTDHERGLIKHVRMNDSEGIRFVRQSKEAVTYDGIELPPYVSLS
jgi:hypothetical protein